jgi:hypothetical protein
MWKTARDRGFDFGEMRLLGVDHVRLDSVYGNAGWQAELERVVAVAVAHGIEPTLVLGSTMEFGSRPSEAAFEAYAREQAAKWAGQARIFEVLNEPDLHGWAPDTYTAYLKAAYRGVKAGNPNAIVSTGGHWKWDCGSCPYAGSGSAVGMVEWVKGMYANGAAGHFDALAVHLYDNPHERGDWNGWDYTFVKPENIRTVMDANGDAAKPIWSTENGAPTPKYSLESQAQTVANAINVVKNQTFPLANAQHYTLHDDDVPGYGLLSPDNQRRPAWYAYQNAIAGGSNDPFGSGAGLSNVLFRNSIIWGE